MTYEDSEEIAAKVREAIKDIEPKLYVARRGVGDDCYLTIRLLGQEKQVELFKEEEK